MKIVGLAKVRYRDIREFVSSDILIEDLIDSRIGVHDSKHFEVKLDYAIRSGETNRYRVESYFFIPSSLGINSSTYSSSHFYRDVQAYIRFKTPSSALRNLSSLEDGPLASIEKLVRSFASGKIGNEKVDEFSREARMFACIYRSQLRDHVVHMQESFESIKASGAIESARDLTEQLGKFVEAVRAFLENFRSMRSEANGRRVPATVRDTYQYIDEFISVTTELKIASLLEVMDEHGIDNQLAKERVKVVDLLIGEREYRENVSYLSERYVDPDDEYFLYRIGKLKKFVTSVLWLEIKKEKEGAGLQDVGAAIAAGIAMLFTVLATIWSSRWYVTNTAAFVVAAIVIYMLKDRIKDWLKRLWAKKLTKVLFDHSVKIRDPISGKNLGLCREAMNYVKHSSLPADVLEARRGDTDNTVEDEAKPEQIIRYEKEIRLSGDETIDRLKTDQHEINDIIRFSLARMLEHADDPKTKLPYFDESQDKIIRKKYRKVYHINLVMVFRHAKESVAPMIKRVRVVFDRSEIIRLEEINSR